MSIFHTLPLDGHLTSFWLQVPSFKDQSPDQQSNPAEQQLYQQSPKEELPCLEDWKWLETNEPSKISKCKRFIFFSKESLALQRIAV